MFKVNCTLPYLQNFQPKTKVCLSRYSQRTGSHSGKSRLLWTLGGGVAIATGLVASLLLQQQPSILGVEEARCKKKDKKDESVDGLKGRKVKGISGLKEARKTSRDLLQRAKDEVGSPGIVAAVSVDGRLLWTEGERVFHQCSSPSPKSKTKLTGFVYLLSFKGKLHHR